MEKFKNIPAWVIVLSFIFMWPVGVVLVILKYTSKEDGNYEKIHTNVTSSANIIKNNTVKLEKNKRKRALFKLLSIIQFVIAIVFFCALLSDIAIDNTENIEGAIIVNVLAFGILVPLCIKFFKLNSLIKKIETYQNLILIRDMYDVKKLSSHLGCSRAEILDFVSYMIREGYLELDIENEEIVKPKEYIDPAQIFSIVCQNCGANNKYVKGKNNKCEYCGSILNLNKI